MFVQGVHSCIWCTIRLVPPLWSRKFTGLAQPPTQLALPLLPMPLLLLTANVPVAAAGSAPFWQVLSGDFLAVATANCLAGVWSARWHD